MPRSLFPHASPETRARLEQDPTLKLFNEYDWASNPLGLIPEWPESLKGAVRTMMVATTPMAMLVGPRGILLYNNRYAQFAGGRHPEIFGMPAEDAWPEVADFNRENVARGMRGEGLSLTGQELLLNRHGQMEAVWLDLHYSPILDDAGEPMGSVCVVIDISDRVLAERALSRSEERMSLAINGSSLVGTWDWDILENRVTSDERFARLYGLDPLRAGIGLPLDEFLNSIHPDDTARVGEDIARAIRDGSDYHSEYRVVTEDGVEKWVVASGRVRFDQAGRAVRFPGVLVDITDQKKTSEALAESEVRFRTLADTMPQMVWSTLPDGFHDYYNARWYEFTGVPVGSTDGEAWNGMFHPEDRERAWASWRHSLETGEPYEIEYRLRHYSGQYRWTLGRALPIRDVGGTIVRWIGTCTDIHESRLAAEERELVAQELSHRIKNIFAVLTSIISLSARSNPEARTFADQLRHRVFALGEAHDFVRPQPLAGGTDGGQGSLSALIARLMRPYNEEGSTTRVHFAGDDTAVDDAAATPLALLFHELATNAAKYGALSNDSGHVLVEGEDRGETYRLVWRETGGPEIQEPQKLSGFGTRLVGLSVEGQMRGSLERHWKPDGIEVVIEVPKEAMVRSGKLRSMPAG